MSAQEALPTRNPSAPTRRRVVNVLVWVVQALLAVLYGYFAWAKLSGTPDTVAVFDRIDLGQWLRYFTGICELAGAIGLLIPRLSGLAALGLVVLMLGATAANVLAVDPAAVPMTLVLCLAFAGIAWYRRRETATLVRSRH